MQSEGAGVHGLSLQNDMQVLLEAPLDCVCHKACHVDPMKVLKQAAYLCRMPCRVLRSLDCEH